uniref:Uncharacterized protein n=1 Tax=Arundo donax TaxID=35708 RepID=A0A0A9AH98_ARUDO
MGNSRSILMGYSVTIYSQRPPEDKYYITITHDKTPIYDSFPLFLAPD